MGHPPDYFRLGMLRDPGSDGPTLLVSGDTWVRGLSTPESAPRALASWALDHDPSTDLNWHLNLQTDYDFWTSTVQSSGSISNLDGHDTRDIKRGLELGGWDQHMASATNYTTQLWQSCPAPILNEPASLLPATIPAPSPNILPPSPETYTLSASSPALNPAWPAPAQKKQKRGRARIYRDEEDSEVVPPTPARPAPAQKKQKRGRARIYGDEEDNEVVPPKKTTRGRHNTNQESGLGTQNQQATNYTHTPTYITTDTVCSGPEVPQTHLDTTQSCRRNAARRYRDKLRFVTDKLEAEAHDLSELQRRLAAQVNQLQGEVFALKNGIFEHAQCEYPPIQTYLEGVIQNYGKYGRA